MPEFDELAAFYTARRWLGADAVFDPALRFISGVIRVRDEHLPTLCALDGLGFIRNPKVDGIAKAPDVLTLKSGEEVELTLSLCPIDLAYYENLDDLLHRTLPRAEPARYFLNPVGEIVANGPAPSPEISRYRHALRLRVLLRSIADLESAEKAVFLTPQSLALPFICHSADLRDLPDLGDLENQLSAGAIERDQRTALFKRSLREYLHTTPEPARFAHLLDQFSPLYDSYRRDFLLWIGQAFGELEKAFEEKRLKFLADLNGILASVQTSILAVPLAMLLVGDKYDLANPARNFLLALTVLTVALVAHKLLGHQRHTLDGIDEAITAIETDFLAKQPQRKQEFQSRLATLSKQQSRVSALLRFLRILTWVIVTIVFLGWFYSFYRVVPPATWRMSWSKPSAAATTPTPSPTPASTPLVPSPTQVPTAAP